MESHHTLAVNSPPRKKTRGDSVVEKNHALLEKYSLSALFDPDASKLLQHAKLKDIENELRNLGYDGWKSLWQVF